MRAPSVTAIVCTRNRADGLKRCLEAMRALQLEESAFELLIVDNGSTDNTPSIIEEFKASAPFQVHHLFEPKTGLSHARNHGLRHANGEIILFTDDDCYVTSDWIAATISLFGSDTRKLLAGRVELFDQDHLQLTMKTDMQRSDLHSIGALFGFLHGANMIFGRRVAAEIGLFDIRFGAGTALWAAEDTDFVYRAFRAGIPISYEPSIIVHHDHGRTTPGEGRRLMRGYHKSKGALAAKYLLQRDLNLLRAVVWDVHSVLRSYWAGKCKVGDVLDRLPILGGMLSYILRASWKNPA